MNKLTADAMRLLRAATSDDDDDLDETVDENLRVIGRKREHEQQLTARCH